MSLSAASSEEINQSLNLDTLLCYARSETNLRDPGDDGFIEPLQTLLQCCREELKFTQVGLMATVSDIQRHLTNRLRLTDALKRHPEILDEKVDDPIIILGMPRTGTTKLQPMMSASPAMQACWFWRMLNPAPFPDTDTGKPDLRIDFAKQIEARMQASDEFKASHETLAEDAEEDSYLLLNSLEYVMQYIVTPSPSYLEFIRSHTRENAYRLEKLWLQYLQWQDGGRQGRPWLLKNPGHLGALDIVNKTFPDALLVNCYRDMNEVIPSYCRLMYPLLSPMYIDFGKSDMGQQALDFWGPELQRYKQQRQALGDTLNIMDVPYLELVREPLTLIEKIYHRHNMQLTEKGRQAMRDWALNNPQHKHGKAPYTAGEYGLSDDVIAKCFPGLP